MSWSDPSATLVWTTGEIATAAKMNLISADLIDLDRRTTPTGAIVATNESTSSAPYVDLATPGPAVTVNIGSTGLAVVNLYYNGSATSVYSFAISGATTVAAADSFSLVVAGRAGAEFLISGLTAGSNTITAKYRSSSGSASFADRKNTVTPLGS